MPAVSTLSPVEYQNLPQVVARIREFCGLVPGSSSRCIYLASMGDVDGSHVTWGHVSAQPPELLSSLLTTGGDIARSLWDTDHLLVYVDLDFIDAGAPGSAFLHPADAFLKLEPAYRALRATFDDFGMPMLDLMTGGGYGFVGRIPARGAAASRLAGLVEESPAWLETHAMRRPVWASVTIEDVDARAHRGLGLLLEFLAHRTLANTATDSRAPIVVGNTEVGSGQTGRECVSIDLSHMGDPLDSRHLRVPFGTYQKHRLRPDIVGREAALMPPLAVIPRARQPLFDLLEHGRSLRDAAERAECADARIPEVEVGLLSLLECYQASRLANWHRAFYAHPPHNVAAWPETYDRFDAASLPPCIAACLQAPNDLLLKPTHLQMLVRVLLARGWEAHHIAGLVWSRYARTGPWGEHWRRIDPRTRAEFDVRIFAGLVAMGLDEGEDLNCVSAQEKHMCPGAICSHDLRAERDRLPLSGRA